MQKITISRDGTEVGVYERNDLVELVKIGEVKSTDHAWHEGLTDWVPVQRLIGLTSEFSLDPGVVFSTGLGLVESSKTWFGDVVITANKFIFTQKEVWWPRWLDWLFELPPEKLSFEISLTDIVSLRKTYWKLLWIFHFEHKNRLLIQVHGGKEYEFVCPLGVRKKLVTLLEKNEKCIHCYSELRKPGVFTCWACGRDQF